MQRDSAQSGVESLARQVVRSAAKFAAAVVISTLLAFGQETAGISGGGDPDLAGQSARVLMVSIPEKKLALIEDGRVLKVYPIATGKPSTPSPSGTMKIINKIHRPTYHHRGQVVPPGKSNPLGSRWLGLSKKGYGIHGTNAPNSIGTAASHGCFRMRNADVEELFTRVRVGDVVEIYSDRDVHVTQLVEVSAAAVPARSEPATRSTKTPPVVLTAMAGGD